jgi:hypothetical protein
MAVFRWEDIDHTLVDLKLTDLAIEINSQTEADERRIQFENHRNMNSNTVASLILEMKEQRADELALELRERH